MVNVPLDVNVWIVCPPLVVIVQPVEEVDTPSLPFVAYEITTIHDPPFPPAPDHHPPQPPHHVFAVPAVPAFASHTHPAPHHPVPPVPFVVNSLVPHPPPPA